MRTLSIVGARPQFIKLAPVTRALASAGVQDVIVHTGQHYDAGMSDVFFDELGIPQPDLNLSVGSGSHGAQTARMLELIEAAIEEQKPDWVIIYGDTNSTVAGALAAAKLHVPIAHVEAGLRSFNRAMPEEINRIVADHVSDLLLAPTETAMQNLGTENLAARSVLTGDVMLDAVRYNSAVAEQRSTILDDLGVDDRSYAVLTLHRASNTEAETLGPLMRTLNTIAEEQIPIVFPMHPRTAAAMRADETFTASERLQIVEPVGFLDMLALVGHARFALTDSGGLQKEAYFLGCPCVTLREETEWLETVNGGGNVLVGPDPERIVTAVNDWLDVDAATVRDRIRDSVASFGDGHAAEAIVAAIQARS